MVPKQARRVKGSLVETRWLAILTQVLIALVGILAQVFFCIILVADPYSNRALSVSGLLVLEFGIVSGTIFFAMILDFILIRCRVNECLPRLKKIQVAQMLRSARRG